MSPLEREAVKRGRSAIVLAGLANAVMELDNTAHRAKDAADAIGCELGAVVKSLVLNIDQRFVTALVAGDHKCLKKACLRPSRLKAMSVGPKPAKSKASPRPQLAASRHWG